MAGTNGAKRGGANGGGGSGAGTSAARETAPREILKKDVLADSRYAAVAGEFTEKKAYQAENLLLFLMKMEQRGETTGAITVYDFESAEGETFRTTVNRFVKALKSAGYKVTEREDTSTHRHGYRGIRKGSRVYASTTKSRRLHFEKI